MKKIIVLIGFVCFGLSYTAQKDVSSISYSALSEHRFNQIEDLLNQQAIYIPIIIKDVPRDELIKFYIQSYDDETISKWTNNAYKKMLSNKLIEIGSAQDKKLKSLMKTEQTKDNMYQFMQLLTDEQIMSVGY